MKEGMKPGKDGIEGFRRDVQRLAAYFCVEDGIIVLTWAAHLQREFDTLTELFDRLGLHINVAKKNHGLPYLNNA